MADNINDHQNMFKNRNARGKDQMRKKRQDQSLQLRKNKRDEQHAKRRNLQLEKVSNDSFEDKSNQENQKPTATGGDQVQTHEDNKTVQGGANTKLRAMFVR
jgi:hypothetical protein